MLQKSFDNSSVHYMLLYSLSILPVWLALGESSGLNIFLNRAILLHARCWLQMEPTTDGPLIRMVFVSLAVIRYYSYRSQPYNHHPYVRLVLMLIRDNPNCDHVMSYNILVYCSFRKALWQRLF